MAGGTCPEASDYFRDLYDHLLIGIVVISWALAGSEIQLDQNFLDFHVRRNSDNGPVLADSEAQE